MDVEPSSSSSSSSSSPLSNPYVPSNPYAARPYQVDDPSVISENLCEIARMDGWHDHHSISGLIKTLGTLIDGHLPTNPGNPACCGKNASQLNQYPAPNEDAYLFYKLAKDLSSPDHIWCKPGGLDLATKIKNELTSVKSRKNIVDGFSFDNTGSKIKNLTDQEISKYYKDVINRRYQVSHVLFTSDKEDDEDDDAVGDDYSNITTTITGESLIQRCFDKRGITENIYIVRDVAYGNWADDICKWKGTSQIITAQMGAGIYDPGPSVSCITKSGKRQGFATSTSGSRFALFDPNNTLETAIELPSYADFTGNTSPENLIYTKFTCLLHSTIPSLSLESGRLYSSSDLKDYFKKTNATLHMMEEKDGKVLLYSVDKDSSNKATDLSKLPLIDAVVKLSPKVGLQIPVTSTFNPGDITDIIQKSGVKKIASKKFGDHNLGITTLHSILHFHKFEPDPANNGTFKPILEKSNGIHGFLSYDRVAVEAALEYGAPFVIYNTHDGAIIFFSNELINKFSSLEAKLDRNIKILEQTITKIKNTKEEYNSYNIGEKKENIFKKNNIISKIIVAIESILTNIRPATNDMDYQRGIAVYYLFSSLLKTYYRSKTLIDETDNSYKIVDIPENTRDEYTNDLSSIESYILYLKSIQSDISKFDTTNTLSYMQTNLQTADKNIKKFNIRKQCDEIFNIIIDQYNDICRKLKIDDTINLQNLTQWFNKIPPFKIREILDKLIESLISSITPFKHTTNTSCIRTFLKMVGVGQKLPDFGWPIAEEIVKSLEGGPAKDFFVRFLKNSVDNVITDCVPDMKVKLKLSIDNMGEKLKGTGTLYSDLNSQIPITAAMSGGKTHRRKYKKIDQKIKTRHHMQKQKQKNTRRKINNCKTQKIMYGGSYADDQQTHKQYTEVIGAAWICWFLIQIYHALIAASGNHSNSVSFDYNPDENINYSDVAAKNILSIILSIYNKPNIDILHNFVANILNPVPDILVDKLPQKLVVGIKKLKRGGEKRKVANDDDEEEEENNMDDDAIPMNIEKSGIIQILSDDNSNLTHLIIASIFGSNNVMYDHFLKIYVQVGYAINNHESFSIKKIKTNLDAINKCLNNASIPGYIRNMRIFYFPMLSQNDIYNNYWKDFDYKIYEVKKQITNDDNFDTILEKFDDIDNDITQSGMSTPYSVASPFILQTIDPRNKPQIKLPIPGNSSQIQKKARIN